MCGIVGIVNDPNAATIVAAMLPIQKHRGPDAMGIEEFGNTVCLGHNRLSIIDLSSSANQPMKDHTGRFSIVFNGEIFNYLELKEFYKDRYQFKTQSDTEVLLAAYTIDGKKCLSKLNGMFAFAIWDREKKELFAARDRYGVKPFYYHFNGTSMYFASEIKTLRDPLNLKAPHEAVWANYFLKGSYGQPDETFYNGIMALPAGHRLTYFNNELIIEKWYDFVARVKRIKQIPYAEAKEFYGTLMESSINLRFRSDVPVGINVSGGVDSSMLLTLTDRHNKDSDIEAFTFYTGDERYDELPWVEQLMAATSRNLNKVKLVASEIPTLAKNIALIQDEPYGGVPTIAYAQIFTTAAKHGVKVLLDGQGMDEQWAGYDYYFQQTDQTLQGVTRSPLRPDAITEKLKKQAKVLVYPKPFEDDLLNKQYRDLFHTKIPRALRFNDRISMANSTELREPFLDYRMVEFAFAQPEIYKKSNGVQKFMLRDLLSEWLVNDVTYAPKRALQTPQREWLGVDLKNWVVSQIDNLKKSPVSDWFDFDQIDNEMMLYFEGEQDSSFHLWQWINTSLLFCEEVA